MCDIIFSYHNYTFTGEVYTYIIKDNCFSCSSMFSQCINIQIYIIYLLNILFDTMS